MDRKRMTRGAGAFLPALVLLATTWASPILADSYHLTYNDEFNEFNPSRYQTSDFWGMRHNGGDYQAQWFAEPDRVPQGSGLKAYNPFSVNDGVLTIRALATPENTYSGGTGGSPGQPYVSGQLTSAHRFTQRYGYYELRAKLPPGKGLWSRFWLLTDDGVWPGEYDIFEVLGKENPVTVHQTTHFRDASTRHGIDGFKYAGIVPTDGEFHTYGFLWEPDGVTWYVDGVATERQVNRIDKPMYFLIDLVVGHDPGNLWPGSPDDTTPLPADMELDYIRVYSTDSSLPSVTPDAGYSPSTLPDGHTVVTTPTTAQLPPGWTAGDLGTPEVKGSATWSPATGEWMLKGAGFGLSGWGDQGHFAGTTLTGDGGVVATVQDVTVINSNDVKTGVMIRETTAANSIAISLLHTSSFHSPTRTIGLTLQARTSNGGATTELAGVDGIPTPVTLRLARSGNTFTGAYSTDGGITWTAVGTPQTLPMAGSVSAGLAIAGNQNNYLRLARAIVTNVSVGLIAPTLSSASSTVATGQTLPFTVSLIDQLTGSAVPAGPVTFSVASGSGTIDSGGVYTPVRVGTGSATIKADFGSLSATRTVTVTLPSPWAATDVNSLGGPVPPGDSGSASGVWTVVGGGPGIATDSSPDPKKDSFRFVSQPLSGNGSITVRASATGGPGTQAGLVIRDATAPGDRSAGVWVETTTNGTELIWATRESAKDPASKRTSQVLTDTQPVWLRLTRSGPSSDLFTAHYSADGSTWTQLGEPRTFAMNPSAQAGVAVASGNAMLTATATFSDLSVASDAPDPSPSQP